eukprot:TRINITY_DN10789_c0_g1_i3.p1 TRINITY_DN10789_c0_g1~~TRINITY_DN10789_c0_g1_i3.p1  ORF type:complete len:240 (-),score=75.90 TRINITY_DN10789_c0_g1_i3:139-858(-)
MEIVENLAKQEIIVYSVGVEPSVGDYPALRGFMRGVSDRTGGRYVPLGNAPLLAAVITGGAREEINLERIAEQVMEEVQQLRLAPASAALPEDALYNLASANLQSRGVTVGQLQVDNVVDAGEDKAAAEVASVVRNSKSLAEAVRSPALQAQAQSVASRPSMVYAASSDVPVRRSSGPVPMAAMPYAARFASAPGGAVPEGPVPMAAAPSYASQSAAYVAAPISSEQVKRLVSRKSAKE